MFFNTYINFPPSFIPFTFTKYALSFVLSNSRTYSLLAIFLHSFLSFHLHLRPFLLTFTLTHLPTCCHPTLGIPFHIQRVHRFPRIRTFNLTNLLGSSIFVHSIYKFFFFLLLSRFGIHILSFLSPNITFKKPRNRFQGFDFAILHRLAESIPSLLRALVPFLFPFMSP
jgi:hypothetical protein